MTKTAMEAAIMPAFAVAVSWGEGLGECFVGAEGV